PSQSSAMRPASETLLSSCSPHSLFLRLFPSREQYGDNNPGKKRPGPILAVTVRAEYLIHREVSIATEAPYATSADLTQTTGALPYAKPDPKAAEAMAALVELAKALKL